MVRAPGTASLSSIFSTRRCTSRVGGFLCTRLEASLHPYPIFLELLGGVGANFVLFGVEIAEQLINLFRIEKIELAFEERDRVLRRGHRLP